MKRFFPNGNNGEFPYDNDDDDDEEFDEEEFMQEIMIDDSGIEMMHLGLVEQQFKQTLLDRAAEIAKQDWFWYFRNTSTRLKRIEKIYERLTKLMETKKE